jgi:hypothetical protein
MSPDILSAMFPVAHARERRFRLAILAPCFPSAVRVFFGSREIVFFVLAALAAFLMFLRAAAFCFVVATGPPLQTMHLVST